MAAKSRAMIVQPLHTMPPTVHEAAAVLLNNTWPRSLSARLHSLREPPLDGGALPCSLVALQPTTDADAMVVVAHARLHAVKDHADAVLIESVVVDTDCRGLGLGRQIMEAAEAYAVTYGLTHSYLSTHDKVSAL